MQILIVEDETKIAEFLAKGLNESGYLSSIAHDGLTALTLLQENFDQSFRMSCYLKLMAGKY